MYTHQKLCCHEISRRSHKSVQSDPHYPMPGTSNLVSTFLSGVGVIFPQIPNILQALWQPRELIHHDPSN